MYPRQPEDQYMVPDSFPVEGPDSILPYFERALSYSPLKVILILLERDPSLCNASYWQGLSALHKACLRADGDGLEVVRALLTGGAKTDSRTNFGETPLMFACKRGSIPLLHILVEAGAKLEDKDKAGRGMMHHACMGGSVPAVHYLHVVHGLSLNDPDSQLVIPFHLVCQMSMSTDLTSYFIRNGTNVMATDAKGNTSLHYAVQGINTAAVWKILENNGMPLLNQCNIDNMTPLDIATQPVPQAPQYMTRPPVTNLIVFLKHNMAALTANPAQESIQPPTFPWWAHLLTPIGLYSISLIVGLFSQIILGWQSLGVLLTAGGIVYTVYTLMMHSHRMAHQSAWPNPAFAGAFGAGLFATTACFLLVLIPFQGLARWPSLVLLCIAPVGFWVYYRLLTGDPGFTVKGRGDPYRVLMDIATGKVPQSSFCSVCEIISSESSAKHCRLCNRCVVDMDHHCLFLLVCVAHENHRRFVIFIGILFIAMSNFLAASCLYASERWPDLDAAHRIARVACEELFLFSMCCLNLPSAIWLLTLLKWQLGLVARNVTYISSRSHYERMRQPLSMATQVRNIWRFLLGFQPTNSAIQTPQSTL